MPNKRESSKSYAVSPFQHALLAHSRAVGLAVRAETVGLLERYYELLRRWNARINLTALRLDGYPSATLNRLILEPIAAVGHVMERSATWIDLGSGGGSPAIPMRVLLPRTRLTMVESKGRKAAFLKEAVRTLGLSGVEVLPLRFEELPSDRHQTADLVTVRAVRVDAAVSAIAGQLLAPGGRLMQFQSTVEASHLEQFELEKAVPILSTDPNNALLVYRRI